MPGVTVMPNSPGLGGFSPVHSGKRMSTFRENGQQTRAISATQNGTGRSYDGLNALDIKEKAKESVQKEARGASPLSLIKTARTQYLFGRENENKGNLKSSLAAYIKAVSLAKLAIDSGENERGGVLRREINEFFEVCLRR